MLKINKHYKKPDELPFGRSNSDYNIDFFEKLVKAQEKIMRNSQYGSPNFIVTNSEMARFFNLQI